MFRRAVTLATVGALGRFSYTHCEGSEKKSVPSFATRAVHAGCDLDPVTGSLIPSISLSTTFGQSFPGEKPGKENPNSFGAGFFYSRMANPTRGALERALAEVEGANHAVCFASGMGTITSVMQLLKNGDHILALNDLYGGTVGLFNNILRGGSGLNITYTDMYDLEKFERAITPQTKMIYLETPTNPGLKSIDLRAVSKIAKKHGCLVVVDGTFLSPYLQNPLDLGVDIVIHSITKYIAGHSDVLMGCAITNDATIGKRLRELQFGLGAVPSPFECYLTLRGLKTLHLRMEASQQNAIKLANYLEGHPMVEKVLYPGLKSYPDYKVFHSQSRGPGAMITIYVKGGLPVAGKFLSELKVFSLAVSLGAVESLACSPAIMTHGSVPAEQRAAIGLTDNLVRLSVGVEGGDDLIEDLKQALEAAQKEFDRLNPTTPAK